VNHAGRWFAMVFGSGLGRLFDWHNPSASMENRFAVLIVPPFFPRVAERSSQAGLRSGSRDCSA
jgi:hypothetical protein